MRMPYNASMNYAAGLRLGIISEHFEPCLKQLRHCAAFFLRMPDYGQGRNLCELHGYERAKDKLHQVTRLE